MKLPLLYATLALWIAACTAQAADITLRPDLRAHLDGLRLVYPPSAASDIVGPSVPSHPRDASDGSAGPRTPPWSARTRIIQLAGRIEPGDADRLNHAIHDVNGTSWSSQAVVVFDSPGGSFLEGLKIGQMLSFAISSAGGDSALDGLFVLKGQRCQSACALAFALGTDVTGRDRRFVEEGAELGFHMALLPDDLAARQAPVGETLTLAYDIISELNILFDGGANPPALLSRMLTHRTSDSFFTLRGWLPTRVMGFTPVSSGPRARAVSASGMTLRMLARACELSYAASPAFYDDGMSEYGEIGIAKEYAELLLSEAVEQFGTPQLTLYSSANTACRVTMRSDWHIGLHSYFGPPQCVNGSPQSANAVCVAPAAPQGTEDPIYTVGQLADLLGCGPDGLVTEVTWFKPAPPPAPRTRSFPTTGRVIRDVNMRAAPSTSHASLGQVRRDSNVSLTDCRITDDDQGLWFQISFAGKQGWVSARFIDRTSTNALAWHN